MRNLTMTPGSNPQHPPVRAMALVGAGLALLLVLSAGLAGCLSAPGPGPQAGPSDTPLPLVTDAPSTMWPPTWTPTATRTPTNTPVVRATFTPQGSAPASGPGQPSSPSSAGGTLTIDFRINKVRCTSGGSYAAEFTVWAQGGDGQYTYYRDIDHIGGPMSGEVNYTLNWKDCGGAPGTFFVKSGDGQRASKLFWVWPPDCCKK